MNRINISNSNGDNLVSLNSDTPNFDGELNDAYSNISDDSNRPSSNPAGFDASRLVSRLSHESPKTTTLEPSDDDTPENGSTYDIKVSDNGDWNISVTDSEGEETFSGTPSEFESFITTEATS